jgi:hypothetical protein
MTKTLQSNQQSEVDA